MCDWFQSSENTQVDCCNDRRKLPADYHACVRAWTPIILHGPSHRFSRSKAIRPRTSAQTERESKTITTPHWRVRKTARHHSRRASAPVCPIPTTLSPAMHRPHPAYSISYVSVAAAPPPRQTVSTNGSSTEPPSPCSPSWCSIRQASHKNSEIERVGEN